ncbi:hypothetical protein, partial [uncultured Nocardioides sp.]|uniref:hypothetical protein n=1 Tax=uncultured Nocardioides sp. TaxID=198441 RepID=UPI002616083E
RAEGPPQRGGPVSDLAAAAKEEELLHHDAAHHSPGLLDERSSSEFTPSGEASRKSLPKHRHYVS